MILAFNKLPLAKDDAVVFMVDGKLHNGKVFGFHYQKVEIESENRNFLVEPDSIVKLSLL